MLATLIGLFELNITLWSFINSYQLQSIIYCQYNNQYQLYIANYQL